jgi:hypothetical protein
VLMSKRIRWRGRGFGGKSVGPGFRAEVARFYSETD